VSATVVRWLVCWWNVVSPTVVMVI